VPLSAKEALTSDLMGLMEKTRCTSFLNWVIGVKPEEKKTWGK